MSESIKPANTTNGTSKHAPQTEPQPSANPHSRRHWMKRVALGTCGLGVTTAGYAWRVEPHWIDVVRLDMPVRNLPERLDGQRLIQISDLHIGRTVDDDYLIGALKQVNGLKPDILALTGDIATYSDSEQFDQTKRILSHLEPAKLGQVAIFGNHEYGAGVRQFNVANRFHSILEQKDFDVLRNASTDVGGLRIFGVDDLWSQQFDLSATLQGVDAITPSLALCHNPDGADFEAWDDFQGWILAGHTHGGQCKIPGLTPPMLPVKNKKYAAGKIAISKHRTLYVNRGLGYLRRVRFCARPEITVFTLRTM